MALNGAGSGLALVTLGLENDSAGGGDVYPTAAMVVDVAHGGLAAWGPGGVGYGPGTYDLPALTSVWDGDTLGGAAGAFPEAARNTIDDPHVQNGFPYIRLGANAIGSAPVVAPGPARGTFHIGL